MHIPILGVRTDAQIFDDALTTLLEWSKSSEERVYVCTCSVYTVMQCYDHMLIAAAVNGAQMVAADGMPLVRLQRRRGYPEAQRVYGPDVMLALCERGIPQGVRHYFWGGLPHVPEQLAEALTQRFAGLQVVGPSSPPIAPLGEQPDPEVIARLNQAEADVIWVGLGSPKQDLWMQLYRPHLKAPLLIGVGAAFDFHAGVKKQAPRWLQRSGLEWGYRLWQEPSRLWRRYLIENPRFLWLIWRKA